MQLGLLHLAYTDLRYFSASHVSVKPDVPTAAHCFMSLACLLVSLAEPSHLTTPVIRNQSMCPLLGNPAARFALLVKSSEGKKICLVFLN